MRLSKDFVIHKNEKETLLVPVGNAGWAGVVRLNDTAADIVEILVSGAESVDAIVEKLKKQYDADESEFKADAEEFIASLRQIEAIIE